MKNITKYKYLYLGTVTKCTSFDIYANLQLVDSLVIIILLNNNDNNNNNFFSLVYVIVFYSFPSRLISVHLVFELVFLLIIINTNK